jgi:hypothetical protein
VETIHLGISIRQLGVELRFTKSFARHLEIADEVVLLASTIGDLNNLKEIGGIASLDVRVWQMHG